MRKRTFRTLFMGMLTVLCSVFAMNVGQACNAMAAENLFEMTPGGSIRIQEPYGLRFQVKMSDDVKATADKVGMLIFPADYLVDDGTDDDVYYESVEELVEKNVSGHRIDLDLTPKLYEKDGYWHGNGAIVNIKAQNMAREFVGIAYYEVNGEKTWADTSKIADTTRSAAQVALLTKADKTHNYSPDAEKLLLQYIDYLKAADVEEGAPTRFQVRGYAADNGLRFYVTQYVNNVVETGDELTEQTHLETEILKENISGGTTSTYYKFWLDGTYECDDSSNVKNVINEVSVTDRGESFEGYRYEVAYEIFIEFKESTDDPYAYVQFKHHLPGETEEGLENSYKEYKDNNRYLWQDNCNSYELRSRGIVAKDVTEGKVGLTKDYFKLTGNGTYTLKNSGTSYNTFDTVTFDGSIMRASNYSVKGTLSLNASVVGAQSRIYISDSSTNEHLIYLERTNDGYEIYGTANINSGTEDNWNASDVLISSITTSDEKYSIDFELIVIGNKIYFLLDEEICYASSNISMTESSIKVSGRGEATTIVKNLSGQIFESAKTAEEYVLDKKENSYNVYKAETGHQAKNTALDFKKNVTSYFMFNDVYEGMKVMDGTVMTKTEVWGDKSGILHALPTANTAATLPSASVVNYGDTSGAKIYAKSNTSGKLTIDMVMPWKVEKGENFVYSADIKVIATGNAGRWISLSVGNKLNEDGTKVTQYHHLVTKADGTVAGIGKGDFGDTRKWTDYKHNNGAQAPIDALGALNNDQTYTFKVIGENITIDGQAKYVLSSYLDDKLIMKDWVIDASEVEGYLGVACNGVVIEVDYDDTIVEKRDTTGYTKYNIDKSTDFSGTKLFERTLSYKEAASPVTYGLTGFAGTAADTNNLIFPYEVNENEDVVFTVPITITATDNNNDYVALSFGNKLIDSNGTAITGNNIEKTMAIDAFYHCAMRTVGSNAGLSRWDGSWQDLVVEDRVPGNVPFEAGKTYVFEIVITDGHILDYYIDDHAILRDFDLKDLEGWTQSGFNTGFPTNAAGYLGIQFKSLSIEVAYSELEGQYEQEYYVSNSSITNEAVVVWDSNNKYKNVMEDSEHPALFAFEIDEDLKVQTVDGTSVPGTLEEICVNIYKANMIPLIYVDNMEEAKALSERLDEKRLTDVMVISSNISALSYVMENTDGPRGVYDVSNTDKTYSKEELAELMHLANKNQVKVILLSESAADYASVRWLQTRMMTVWARNTDDMSNYNLLANGVDGIVTADYENVFKAMSTFTGTNVLLRLPSIVGHRGSLVGADGSKIPEVTVDSLLQATAFGADAVENDVFCTADGVLVLQHDKTTERMMTNDLVNGTGSYSYAIQDVTYQTLYDNLVYQAQWSADKDGNFVPRHINTLEEQFIAFSEAGEDNVVFYIEFKNSTKSIKVDKVLDDEDNLRYYTYNANGETTVSVNEYCAYELKRLSQKYGVEDQCLVISFDTGFLSAMHKYYPEMSAGLLITDPPYDDIKTIVPAMEGLNACYHPRTVPSENTLRASYARGIITNAWAYSFSSYVCKYFTAGNVQSVTTNDTHQTTTWAERIVVKSDDIKVKNNAAFDLGVSVIDYAGNKIENAIVEIVTISGNGLKTNENRTYALNDGSTVVMVKYASKLAGTDGYMLYSKPIKITSEGSGTDDTVVQPIEVASETELKNAIKTIGNTDDKIGFIKVTKDFTISATVTIPAGVNVTISDDGTARTITRATTGTEKALFSVTSGGALAVVGTSKENSNPTLTIDGGSAIGITNSSAAAQLINNKGYVNVGKGVHLTNNESSADVQGLGIYSHEGSATIFSGMISNIKGTHKNAKGNVFIIKGDFILTDAIVSNNTAVYGGVIRVQGGQLTAINTVFEQNSSTGLGGVILINSAANKLSLDGCTFKGNSAVNGGAIYNNQAINIEITNCRFENNTASQDGGAIYMSKGTLTHAGCTFSGNTATEGDNDDIYSTQ